MEMEGKSGPSNIPSVSLQNVLMTRKERCASQEAEPILDSRNPMMISSKHCHLLCVTSSCTCSQFLSLFRGLSGATSAARGVALLSLVCILLCFCGLCWVSSHSHAVITDNLNRFSSPSMRRPGAGARLTTANNVFVAPSRVMFNRIGSELLNMFAVCVVVIKSGKQRLIISFTLLSSCAVSCLSVSKR